jgi:UDP-N-acetylglucosamine/UDP-N-acetylgalactosamine diphosphorylase
MNQPPLHERLAAHHQQHVLRDWDRWTDEQQRSLAGQIAQLDLDALAAAFRGQSAGENWAELSARASAPPAIRLHASDNRFSTEQARQRGAAALKAGKVAALLVAGGQGTRLGFDHPKGLYQVGPVSGASLFQILLEKVLATGRRYGVAVPLYLMTSPATHAETLEFLAANGRFGLPESDVHVFCQGTMPAVDAESGRLLLDSPGSLALSPDGHGGMLAALARSGGLSDLAARGIEQLFYFQVDNPLAPVCDPDFLGYHLLAGSELSTLVVAKQFPTERVGNVANVDGRLRIIEYSDLPEAAANRRRPDGSLELWAGNTAIHVFDVALLKRLSSQADALPFHLAHKAVPHLDEQGRRVEPSKPNAIKFERFIFDLLPAARNGIVVEADPSQSFAPLKNAPGSERDSPETVHRQMVTLHRSWLEAAGMSVADGIDVEISPLFALDAEQAAKKLTRPDAISKPTYFE